MEKQRNQITGSPRHGLACGGRKGMSGKEEHVSIPVGTKGLASATLALPEGRLKRAAIIVAHGAGNDMNNLLITSFSKGVASAGYFVLRFNFLYTSSGRRVPDRQEVLEETWLSVYRWARERLGDSVDFWIAAGKSMGGRVASQLVAARLLSVHGLIFLGYPLHPAGDKTKLRDGHLYDIRVPMLFFAGTRDQLCDTEKLSFVLGNLKASWELYTIEGGDHSFHLPRGSAPAEEIYGNIADRAVTWLANTFP